MNQKGLIKILIIGLITVIVITVGGYFISVKINQSQKNNDQNKKQENNQNQGQTNIQNQELENNQNQENNNLENNELGEEYENENDLLCFINSNFGAEQARMIYNQIDEGGTIDCYNNGCPLLANQKSNFLDWAKSLSSDILESNNKIKEYIENKSRINFEGILVERGNFDINSDRETLVVSLCKNNCEINLIGSNLTKLYNKGFYDNFIIEKKKDGSYGMSYFYTNIYSHGGENNFLVKPLAMVKSGKSVFMGSDFGCGGGADCYTTYYLFQIQDGELKPLKSLACAFSTTSSVNENYDTIFDNRTIDSIILNDFDNDKTNEIIIAGKTFSGTNEDHYDNITNYQIIFKWDTASQKFLQIKN
ncbi:MAG TPA: hypothetical protein PKM85_01940 [Candidatus Pacearchaeota archaeon]|nr:hypothetical protein [Candidatus Pacearchaeota archaeon]